MRPEWEENEQNIPDDNNGRNEHRCNHHIDSTHLAGYQTSWMNDALINLQDWFCATYMWLIMKLKMISAFDLFTNMRKCDQYDAGWSFYGLFTYAVLRGGWNKQE